MGGEVVLDIETKKSFEEVGGHENLTALGVSCACAYFYSDNSYRAYEEHELPGLEERLVSCSRIIGFNINNFDFPVLSAYFDLNHIKHVSRLDLFEEVTKKLGHRISLESLATATLNAKKSGSGLQALQWYKEGKMDEIKKYCTEDVRLTKELYEYGKTHGKLFYTSYFKTDKLIVEVGWKNAPPLYGTRQQTGFQGRLL